MRTATTSERGPITVATLGAMAVVCLAVTATFTLGASNTSFFSKEGMTSRSLRPAAVSRPAAPLESRLDIAVLGPEDAERYRQIFAAQARKDWTAADALRAGLRDRRLDGAVLADRYRRRAASRQELNDWLQAWGDLPDAETFHAQARRLPARKGDSLPAPKAPPVWSAGAPETGGGADFTNGPDFASPDAGSAAALFRNGERVQAESLAEAAGAAGQPLGLWIAGLIAWEKGDRAGAARNFTSLADHPSVTGSGEAAAHFWAWRALGEPGGKPEDASPEARRHLEEAARHPEGFYGLLAAHLLGHGVLDAASAARAVPAWTVERRKTLASLPAGWRALALLQAGQPLQAEAELRRLNPQGKKRLLEAMLALASAAPMPGLAVQLAALAGPESGFGAARYPLPSWEPHHGFQIDRALLFALARHESRFDPQAVSNRGARGLLQIMPTTANGILGHGTASANTPGKLFDPAYNLGLGQRYVKHLASLPQIGNNLLLLLAAYNGGPTKVARWLSEGEGRPSDPLLFLESIPQRETRAYVARVMTHYWTYRARLGRSNASLTQMAEGRWPKISLKEESPRPLAFGDGTTLLADSSER